MVFFCPTCANMLLVENEINGMRLFCQTCPYVYHLQVSCCFFVVESCCLWLCCLVEVFFELFNFVFWSYSHHHLQEELSVKLPLETKKVWRGKGKRCGKKKKSIRQR